MEAFAAWAGKTMPQRPQWEKAARGDDERQWPWGNEWDPKKANVSPSVDATKKKVEATRRARARSLVWTWPATSPSGLPRSSTRSTQEGYCGTFEMDAADTKSHRRLTAVDDEVSVLYGFRCVQD
jgi:hypothetical protein